MQYWLLKSEPDVWSLSQQKRAGPKGAAWDGVRNYQARNNLKKMKKGDLCFFYHSNIGKEIVGIVKIVKEAFADKTILFYSRFNPGPFINGALASRGHLDFAPIFKSSIKFFLYLLIPAQAIIAALSPQNFMSG